MTRSTYDRWWPAMRAAALFAAPPFPGSKATPLIIGGASPSVAPSDIAQCVTSMRKRRVGGTFWAAQPPLAAAHRIIARPCDLAQYRVMAAQAAQEGQRPIFWFPDAQALQNSGAAIEHALVGPCDPWHVLANTGELWASRDDELALLAAIAGTPRRGMTDDDSPIDAVAELTALFAAGHCRDPFSGTSVAPLALIKTLGFWRELIETNRPIGSIYGVAFWKRESIAPLLWDGSTTDRFHNAADRGHARAAAVWIARTQPSALSVLRQSDRPLYQIEDGFIRSVGLGADCVPPLSIVVDPQGAHYDPAQPSALETMLQHATFAPDMLDRARRLRELIVARGISKYAHGTHALPYARDNRRHVLVTGQVEDDQSVMLGGGGITSNLDLLRRVRACEPTASITYRPHPDVDAGHRQGHVDDNIVLTIADAIARDAGITDLIDAADHVHVLTSLAGFEALIRGKSVTTHGVPFYAGWGLTEDLGPVPTRRSARRALDELVAATLLLYPRYLDPLTGLPCPPEVLIGRIAAGVRRQNTALVVTRRLVGWVMRRIRSRVSARV